jgi:glycosyltransferase involved in cell wall biosynthesis
VIEPSDFSPTLRLSVVMPAFNSASTIERSVDAVLAAMGPQDELILANDASTDGSIDAIEASEDSRLRVVHAEKNIGRGPVRNLGAQKATGDVLIFVDSDVAVHADAFDRLREAFATDSELVAVIGSYDTAPGDDGVVSQYRNLLHHHTHQTRPRTASHFWTGLGAIRRTTFIELGGLDTDLWARNMEDVEFGHRVRDTGNEIVVMPDVQGSHLKAFTTRSMFYSDLRERAIPWSNLMMSDGFRVDHFVVSFSKVVSVLCVAVMGLALVASPWFEFARYLFLAAAIVFLGQNASLWWLMYRQCGLRAALASIPLHLLHSFTCGLGALLAIANRSLWILRGRPPEATPAGDIRSRRWGRNRAVNVEQEPEQDASGI